MRAKFYYDLEKDLANYKQRYLKTGYRDYGYDGKLDLGSVIWPTQEREILQANDEAKEAIVRKCLNEFSKEEKTMIEAQITALQTVWEEKEGRFIQRMEKYFGSPFNISEYSVYFTSLGISPYNLREKTFMVRLISSLPEQIGTICHELMHLYFMNGFQIYLAQNGLDEDQILNINEALTILLNFEFSDYIVLPEKNKKPSTYPLQDEIVKMYRDGKEFPAILDRLIEISK